MKKILVAFEGTHFPQGALDFVVQLNKQHPVVVAGVFAPIFEISSLWSHGTIDSGPLIVPTASDEETQVMRKNLKLFEQHCTLNGIRFIIHKDYFDFATDELERESRFADLLIIGNDNSKTFPLGLSLDDLTLVAHKVECPILIVPDKFEYPRHVLLAYDGSESSVFAIKQFYYVLSEFRDKETLLAYVNRDEEKDIPHKKEMIELVSAHYSSLEITKLPFEKKFFHTWLQERPATLVVCGSFARSGISNMVKRSFVKDILAEGTHPIFIAHK
jgi:hypothetical protein